MVTYCTVIVTVVECVRLPLVPMMVRVYVPRATCFFVSTVNVEFPELTIEDGVNFTDADLGAPLADSVVVPEKPGPAVILTVYDATPFRATVTDEGVAAIEKSPVTTSVTFTLCTDRSRRTGDRYLVRAARRRRRCGDVQGGRP